MLYGHLFQKYFCYCMHNVGVAVCHYLSQEIKVKLTLSIFKHDGQELFKYTLIFMLNFTSIPNHVKFLHSRKNPSF